MSRPINYLLQEVFLDYAAYMLPSFVVAPPFSFPKSKT